MKRFLSILSLALPVFSIVAQTLPPVVTSWIINTTGATGYNNIPSNVQAVSYTTTDVYVTATCIPGYDIGPWVGNPNTPSNQNFTFKITRSPQQNTGNPIATSLGHIGVWSNGVSIFNAKDAFSYQNQGIWNQDAIMVEGSSFDDCLGHPAPNGEYHHHLNPTCLYDDTDSSQHSPIIGYAFDGFPIYGAYAFANTNGTGGITRMKTSYRKRNITQRTTLPDGSSLQPNQYGPAINSTYPLGYYIEDYEYVTGLGDLDEFNGRFCVTPEYPGGIYAYFVTIDANGDGAYPYIIGSDYYGTVPSGNTGPQSGHNTVPGNATAYNPPTGTVTEMVASGVSVFPNPFKSNFNLNADSNLSEWELQDLNGRIILQNQPTTGLVDAGNLGTGVYVLRATYRDGSMTTQRIVKAAN